MGTGGTARAMVHAIVNRGGLTSIAGQDDKYAQKLAGLLKCRFVPFQSMYDALIDVVVIADASLSSGAKHGSVILRSLRSR